MGATAVCQYVGTYTDPLHKFGADNSGVLIHSKPSIHVKNPLPGNINTRLWMYKIVFFKFWRHLREGPVLLSIVWIRIFVSGGVVLGYAYFLEDCVFVTASMKIECTLLS